MEEVGTAEQGSRLRKPLRHRPLGESSRALLRTYKVLTARAQNAQWCGNGGAQTLGAGKGSRAEPEGTPPRELRGMEGC